MWERLVASPIFGVGYKVVGIITVHLVDLLSFRNKGTTFSKMTLSGNVR